MGKGAGLINSKYLQNLQNNMETHVKQKKSLKQDLNSQ